MKSLLIGEAAQSMDVHAIREAILSEPIIAEIEDLRTEQLGPDDILVVGSLRVDSVSAGGDLRSVDAGRSRASLSCTSGRVDLLPDAAHRRGRGALT